MDRPRLRQGKGLWRGTGAPFRYQHLLNARVQRDLGREDRVGLALTEAWVHAKVGHVGPLAEAQATETTRRKGRL